MKNKYPSWFDYYTAPRKPEEPAKEITVLNKVWARSIGSYEILDLENINFPQKGELCVEIECNDIFSNNVLLTVNERITKPNPKYKAQYSAYQRALKLYEARIEEWKALVEEVKREKASAKAREERKEYERLKKKFEK